MNISINSGVLTNRRGALILISIILSIFTIGFLGSSFYGDWKDEIFLCFIIIFFIISVILLFLEYCGVVALTNRRIDSVYHGLAFVVLLVCSILFFVSLLQHDEKLAMRIFGLIFGVFATFSYGLIAVIATEPPT